MGPEGPTFPIDDVGFATFVDGEIIYLTHATRSAGLLAGCFCPVNADRRKVSSAVPGAACAFPRRV